MKHGGGITGGIKGLDDKSSGMEILMAEVFAKIKPTDPLILGRHTSRRKRKWPDSSAKSLRRVLHVFSATVFSYHLNHITDLDILET